MRGSMAPSSLKMPAPSPGPTWAMRSESDRTPEERNRPSNRHGFTTYLAGEDAYTETEILIFTASLRRGQARYREAEHLTDRAIALYREGQDSHLEGAALILKGLILGQDGRCREAIPLCRMGLHRIDPQK